MAKIEIKAIGDLIGKGFSFKVPNYQRGYRWGTTQVRELLDDFLEFFGDLSGDDGKEGGQPGDYYCLQPVVVKRSQDDELEVIDGQQRLTTLYILFCELGVEEPYTIRYETRPKSAEFLANLRNHDSNASEVRANPDFYHFVWARDVIRKFMEDIHEKKSFVQNVLEYVKVIWYEADDEDTIKIFTRLNVGKIGLTNAELIKALLLKRSNFDPVKGVEARSPSYEELSYEELLVERGQLEIATQWDAIERRLEDDAFWLFFHGVDSDVETRIDFLFKLMTDTRFLGDVDDFDGIVGDDRFASFRYFHRFLIGGDVAKAWGEVWRKIRDCFQALEAWYDDVSLYHYIGFLLADEKNPVGRVNELMRKWQDGDKVQFRRTVQEEVDKSIKSIDMDAIYDDAKLSKSKAKPLLLFHNVMTTLRQNGVNKGELGRIGTAFVRFPFHLYKKESWDVEHVASNTENDLAEFNDQCEWLKCNLSAIRDEQLKTDVRDYMSRKRADQQSFDNLHGRVEQDVCGGEPGQNHEGELSDDERNKIWNFVLLDSGTNRAYGNALFPTKRAFIIARDRGVKLRWDSKEKRWRDDEPLLGAFVPICTRKVFLKQYTPSHDLSKLEWGRVDAEAYLNDIKLLKRDFEQQLREKA